MLALATVESPADTEDAGIPMAKKTKRKDTPKSKRKDNPAQALARKRWENTTAEERSEHTRRMARKRWEGKPKKKDVPEHL
jgi:hypothetical protein